MNFSLGMQETGVLPTAAVQVVPVMTPTLDLSQYCWTEGDHWVSCAQGLEMGVPCPDYGPGVEYCKQLRDQPTAVPTSMFGGPVIEYYGP